MNTEMGTSWQNVMDVTDFAAVSDDGNGTQLFSEDVNENRVNYIWGLVLSDNSGADNTVTIEKVNEDDSTETIINNFNLGANETRFLTATELGVIMPRVEGGANVQFTAGSDGIDVTAFHVPNEV